jgi:hypothetical protein
MFPTNNKDSQSLADASVERYTFVVIAVTRTPDGRCVFLHV